MPQNRLNTIQIFLSVFVITTVYFGVTVKNKGNSLIEEDRFAWKDLEIQEFSDKQAGDQVSGKTYYVAQKQGNDQNPGTTEKLAFKTIQQANQKVSAGDIVYIKNGIYNENITVTNSGKPKQWIIFKAFTGHKPFVIGTQDGTLRIEGNYIQVIGLRITSTKLGSGIYIGKGNHHTKIINNEIHDSGCGGISGQETDYLYIEGNIVYRNAFRSPYQCSGITIYQAKAFDNNPGFHNIIRGNISYANENKLAKENGKVSDGNGIIIDDLNATQGPTQLPKYTAWTLVENNIVFDNGGKGIHVFESENVIVRNNTAFKNLKSVNLEGELNGELATYFSDNVKFYNNIAYGRDKSKKTFVDAYSQNNEWDYNLSYNGSIFIDKSNSNAVLGKHNIINRNPLMVQPSIIPNQADFRLQSGSPAINSGASINVPNSDFNGKKRPLGKGYDIGAYEFEPDKIVNPRKIVK